MASYLSNWNSDGHSPYVFTNSASASASSFIIDSSYSSINLVVRVSPCFIERRRRLSDSTWVEMFPVYVRNVNRWATMPKACRQHTR